MTIPPQSLQKTSRLRTYREMSGEEKFFVRGEPSLGIKSGRGTREPLQKRWRSTSMVAIVDIETRRLETRQTKLEVVAARQRESLHSKKQRKSDIPENHLSKRRPKQGEFLSIGDLSVLGRRQCWRVNNTTTRRVDPLCLL